MMQGKALPPVKPEAKLPIVFFLTIVKDPERKEGWWNVVILAMQGERVIGRRVLDPAEPNVDHCLDNLNRVATRVFYFEEGEDFMTT